jgi:hypothetical protein
MLLVYRSNRSSLNAHHRSLKMTLSVGHRQPYRLLATHKGFVLLRSERLRTVVFRQANPFCRLRHSHSLLETLNFIRLLLVYVFKSLVLDNRINICGISESHPLVRQNHGQNYIYSKSIDFTYLWPRPPLWKAAKRLMIFL